MTDPLLSKITVGDYVQSDPGAAYNYLIINKPGPALSPVLQFRGGSYYYGRIEFQDGDGNVKAVIRSDGAIPLRFDMRENTTGISFVKSGGSPVLFFSPNSEIKDYFGRVMLSTTGLGTEIKNSYLTSVGTLSSLAVTGDSTIGNVYADTQNARVGINKADPNYSLDIVGDCNTTVDYKINGNTIISETAIAPSIKSSSLESIGTLSSLNVTGETHVGNLISDGPITSYSMSIQDTLSVGDIYNPTDDYTRLNVGGLSSFKKRLTCLEDIVCNGVITSSISSTDYIDTASGYKINGVDVLSGSTLGSTITTSSLTSVGTLASLTVSGNLSIDSPTLTVDSVNNRVGISTATPAYALSVLGTTGLNISDTGNVGLGQIPGPYKFSMTGSSNFNGTLGQTGNFRVNSTGIYCRASDKQVGIGNDVPAYTLDVTGTINGSSTYKINGTDVLSATTLGSGVTSSSLTSVGTLANLVIGVPFNPPTDYTRLNVWAMSSFKGSVQIDSTLSALTTTTQDLVVTNDFKVYDTYAPPGYIIFAQNSTRRVGINNNTPQYTLDSTGDINTSTKYKIGGTDVLVYNVTNKNVAIGTAGNTSQGASAVAVGIGAGNSSQGLWSVAMGENAGSTSQGTSSVAIGRNSGRNSQSGSAVAIGLAAAETGQGIYGVAVGSNAGQTYQNTGAVAVGKEAGNTHQGYVSVAVGNNAGQTAQGQKSVAVGFQAGKTYQSSYTVAIGNDAGSTGQGENSIAIGNLAGQTNQHSRSTVLNATGAALNTTDTDRFFVAPIRGIAAGKGVNVLCYDPTTCEIYYSTT